MTSCDKYPLILLILADRLIHGASRAPNLIATLRPLHQSLASKNSFVRSAIQVTQGHIQAVCIA